MPKPKPSIGRRQRDGLYELIRNHLAGLGDVWIALEREGDHDKAARLAHEFGRDFRLLADSAGSRSHHRAACPSS